MPASIGRSAVIVALALIAAALFPQGAHASITPTISLDQSAGTQAGATQNLGMDLRFTDSFTDSPDVMSINLPPGLLADAAMSGGTCLTTADLSDTSCQVGTGTVTADAIVDAKNLDALTVPVTFDLVPPPAPGDLAGLAVNVYGQQIGQTADVRIRPSGAPDGVGVTIDFVLPNSLDGVPIEITEINSTFDGLRYPAACPSTPADLSVAVDSYKDPTVQTVTAPLHVTGCSSLPYAPKLAVSVARDRSDRSVSLTTVVTQAADEAPSRSLSLAFPDAAMGVNLASIRLLCGNPSTDHCTPVGVATADSPLYPTPLTANAYLTGTALGPSLTLVFPPPFPLTLTGSVTLTSKTASFSGLPDIPLTSLTLKLNGGADALFLTNCNPSSGLTQASSTDQNGDRTASASVKYDIAGCPVSSSQSVSRGADSPPSITSPALLRASTGHPSLRFRVSVRRGAARLRAIRIKLSRGISFVRRRVGGDRRSTGVEVRGARVRSVSITRGQLLIRLRRPARTVRVELTGVLREGRTLLAEAAAHRAVRVRLTLTSLNTRNRRHRITRTIKLASS